MKGATAPLRCIQAVGSRIHVVSLLPDAWPSGFVVERAFSALRNGPASSPRVGDWRDTGYEGAPCSR